MKTKFFLLALLASMTMTFSCSDSNDNPVPEGPGPQEPEQNDPEDPEKTDEEYKIGDFYNKNGIKGVVYKTKEKGTPGMMVALEEGDALQWSVAFSTTGTEDKYEGSGSLDIIRAIPNWETFFPVFKWCDGVNKDGIDGWYIPSVTQLQLLYRNSSGANTPQIDARNQFNRSLVNNGGTALSQTEYWSSSECSGNASSIVNFQDNSTFCGIKTDLAKVRAIRSF